MQIEREKPVEISKIDFKNIDYVKDVIKYLNKANMEKLDLIEKLEKENKELIKTIVNISIHDSFNNTNRKNPKEIQEGFDNLYQAYKNSQDIAEYYQYMADELQEQMNE